MGTQLPHGKQPPLFGPCLLWPNGRPSQQLLTELLLGLTDMHQRRLVKLVDGLLWTNWQSLHPLLHTDISCCTLHGTALPYMTSQFTRVADMSNWRRLRSASFNQLNVPSFRLPTVGSRAFPTAGAKVWNSLPDDVTSAVPDPVNLPAPSEDILFPLLLQH